MTSAEARDGLVERAFPTIVRAITQEYPNALRHLMTDAHDRPTPRDVHPAFYGCLDWHSAVEMHWALLRLLRSYDAGDTDGHGRATIAAHLTGENVRTEADYFARRPGFERPYGWAWLLMLAEELEHWESGEGRTWSRAVRILADVIVETMLTWLGMATYPTRDDAHANGAFALTRSLPWARRLAANGDGRLLDAITRTARRWYVSDREAPAHYEPGGTDFLSPALAEAELLAALDPSAFGPWLEAFLPGLALAQPRSLFTPAIVSDASDGQTAHLHGLNLYRASAMTRIANALDDGDARVDALRAGAVTHAAASLPEISGSPYMVEHWLAAYAVLLFDAEAAMTRTS